MTTQAQIKQQIKETTEQALNYSLDYKIPVSVAWENNILRAEFNFIVLFNYADNGEPTELANYNEFSVEDYQTSLRSMETLLYDILDFTENVTLNAPEPDHIQFYAHMYGDDLNQATGAVHIRWDDLVLTSGMAKQLTYRKLVGGNVYQIATRADFVDAGILS